ncbi:hypothetical protein AVEN_102847-1 [Araneus ventricosus]|uniref:Uncharacterized protein n=1 Tax=Araneus ventricosus TaxID=182803 RepID=A0A4Y2CQE3_ARAVE|nr:hypothetical protein AVEN_102847-1 [Araneus ventricosus]
MVMNHRFLIPSSLPGTRQFLFLKQLTYSNFFPKERDGKERREHGLCLPEYLDRNLVVNPTDFHLGDVVEQSRREFFSRVGGEFPRKREMD